MLEKSHCFCFLLRFRCQIKLFDFSVLRKFRFPPKYVYNIYNWAVSQLTEQLLTSWDLDSNPRIF